MLEVFTLVCPRYFAYCPRPYLRKRNSQRTWTPRRVFWERRCPWIHRRRTRQQDNLQAQISQFCFQFFNSIQQGLFFHFNSPKRLSKNFSIKKIARVPICPEIPTKAIVQSSPTPAAWHRKNVTIPVKADVIISPINSMILNALAFPSLTFLAKLTNPPSIDNPVTQRYVIME